jgi:hypothetical protein
VAFKRYDPAEMIAEVFERDNVGAVISTRCRCSVKRNNVGARAGNASTPIFRPYDVITLAVIIDLARLAPIEPERAAEWRTGKGISKIR